MKSNTQNLLIPGAIVLAGVLIAGGFIFRGGEGTTHTDPIPQGTERQEVRGTLPERDVRSHVFGNPDAPVTIVEFSDYECPFCARLHPTLARVVEESDGGVNWEYRHFPLASIHRNATGAAVASECVAELAGNDAFWEFTDAAFANQRSLSSTFYENEVQRLGIDLEAFRSCTENQEIIDIVQADLNTAVQSGGTGTPFVVVKYEDGSQRTFSGALPYEQVSALVNR